MSISHYRDITAFVADYPDRLCTVVIPVGPDADLAGWTQAVLPEGIRSELMRMHGDGALETAAAKIVTSFVGAEEYRVRLACVGTGAEEPGREDLRFAIGAALRQIPTASPVVVVCPDAAPATIRAITEGAILGDYRFEHFKSEPTQPRPGLAVISGGDADAATAEVDAASIVANGVALARELGNTPPSELTPEAFADLVREQAEELGLTVQQWDAETLRAEGFGGITGVGVGSVNPPTLVKVEYRPEESRGHLSIVGKGITFDSGGLGIKPRAAMMWMKCDMGGAAAAFGAITALARLHTPVRVTAWLALAENMPSGTATKPLDVLRMKNGVTVEVTDTDAEGRLVLGDALVVAAEEGPDLLVDVATLTGAQIVALGNRTSAIMAPTQEPADCVLRAAATSGECMWQLPMPAHLAQLLDSPVADLANMGGNEGGVIVGAHFLQRFVPADQPWAHVDIAGPAINTAAPYGYTSAGATGAGVRTLVELARGLSHEPR